MKNELKQALLSDHGTSVQAPGAKLAGLLALLGISSWTDAAALLAAVYSFVLICEWAWGRIFRPFCERRGWVERKRRRKDDVE